MTPAYSIDQPHPNIVRVTVVGLWDDATLRRYEAELCRTLRQRGAAKSGKPALLVDLRQSVPQSQGIALELQRIASMISTMVGKAAIVVPTMLDAFQARRVSETLSGRTFASATEAIRWLGSSDAEPFARRG